MKIGIIGTRGIPNNYGGFEQFAQYLSESLSEKNCTVFVYNSHNHLFKEKKWKNVNIIHKFDPEFLIGFSGQFLYDFNCIIDSRKRNFDIILQLGYTTNSIWHFLLPKNTLRICNPDGMEWNRAKYPYLVKQFLKYAEKLIVKSNHIIIADSEVIKNYYIQKYQKETYFIAYPASVFLNPDFNIIKQYNITPNNYNLLIARLQKDNNIETIINGIINSNSEIPLLIIGNYNTKYGKFLRKNYSNKKIIFLNSIYNELILNNLRFFSNYYFHGHSAGGTNPSLLEAMACSCLICANDNQFNKSVLGDDAFYFSNSNDITNFVNSNIQKSKYQNFIINNIEKIETNYNLEKITNNYINIFNKLLSLKNNLI